MTKRLFFVLVLALLVVLPGKAVLKEDSIKQTLYVLKGELVSYYTELKKNSSRYNHKRELQRKQMSDFMKRTSQIQLMLYSQKDEYTFDLAYACHEATEMYREYTKRRMPYDQILASTNKEIESYQNLIDALEMLPPILKELPPPSPKMMKYVKEHNGGMNVSDSALQAKRRMPYQLDDEDVKNRAECLRYAKGILRLLNERKATVELESEVYERTSKFLNKINNFAMARYGEIKRNIFVNGGNSYFTTLSRLKLSASNARSDAEDKYRPIGGPDKRMRSQWRGPIVYALSGFILAFLLIAIMLSNIVIRWLVPKRFRTEEFKQKRFYITLVAAVIIFALAINVMRLVMNTDNFWLMASILLIQFAWLIGVILLSLLIRLSGKQIKSGFRVYTPIMLMGFIVITFRIIFIPNNLVSLIFPPILLIFTIWQLIEVRRHNKNIPKSDILYTWVSFVIMSVATIASWAGYNLMAVLVLIWWLFQLTYIQTITCLFDLLGIYEARYLVKKVKGLIPINKKEPGKITKEDVEKAIDKLRNNKGAYIERTWFFDFIYKALVPIIGVLSVLWSIWLTASVFDLSDSLKDVFLVNFIDIPNVIRLSLQSIVMSASLWFLFHYINYLFKALTKRHFKQKTSNAGNRPNITLANNIIAILVWGAYLVIVMIMLKIPAGAIEIISAGLATGVGFAMKDLLENFFYGLSLMTGRVKVGDYIECDGIRGKVESITYQSTQIATIDGSIIAFLNSALFSKNFKNLTKNHNYERVAVPLGVAYGADVNEVREMLLVEVNKLRTKNKDGRDIIHPKMPMSVVFDDFGESSVNLFLIYWVLVEEKLSMTAKVKEVIYNTLNAHKVEIPFPQRDVYIKQIAPVGQPLAATPQPVCRGQQATGTQPQPVANGSAPTNEQQNAPVRKPRRRRKPAGGDATNNQ